VAKTLSNFAKKKLNCYAKCRKAEHREHHAGGHLPAATEAKATACIQRGDEGRLPDRQEVRRREARRRQARVLRGLHGATRAPHVEAAIDTAQPELNTGSPTGAYLDADAQ
jgi:hypothetical protein